MDRPTQCDLWVRRLEGSEADKDAAIGELRVLLGRGLQRSLQSSIYDLRSSGPAFIEDVVQEALLKILDSLESFQGRSQFTTWAMAIATRIGLSELRRHHYRDVSLDAIASGRELDFESTEPPVTRDIERKSVLETLGRLIHERLSDKQRLAMRGYLEGLPMAEIARRTDSNRNAVYKLVHDARRRLRTGFEEAGITAHDIEGILA